jgi:pyruvate dehydrogenase E2 component (dihydrolipoyllysine-residue acetyltransferase)
MATEVLVPPLGTTVDTVTLVKWYNGEGEAVTKGSPLFAIETDKATLDVEAPGSGVLRRVLAQVGDAVKALSCIALITSPEEELAESAPVAPPIAAVAAPELARQLHLRHAAGGGVGRVFISPRARRLAEEHKVSMAELHGSGPEGAIIERDVRAHLAARSVPAITPVAQRMAEQAGLDWGRLTGSGAGRRVTREDVERALSPAEAVPDLTVANESIETIPMRGVRSIIAERMRRSTVETARVTLAAQADATALVALRQQLAKDGVIVSYNDVFIYVLSRALREHPQLNTSMDGDTIKVWRRIHVGLAVDTERGLLVPVVRDADTKGLAQLGQETQQMIERAQAGRSTPDDLSGGTFTLTNLGMYGIDAFTPIINLPECAILGVGRITRQPVMIGDRVVGRHTVWLSLSFDHRLVDGAPAARFLQRVVQLVERPHLLMV